MHPARAVCEPRHKAVPVRPPPRQPGRAQVPRRAAESGGPLFQRRPRRQYARHVRARPADDSSGRRGGGAGLATGARHAAAECSDCGCDDGWSSPCWWRHRIASTASTSATTGAVRASRNRRRASRIDCESRYFPPESSSQVHA